MTGLDRSALEQLLGREAASMLGPLDRRAFKGQRVLVTGAGGSVGSELARQLAACGPRSLTLFDHAEYDLFQIDRQIREAFPDVDVQAVLGDVTRRADIRAACLGRRPTAVYHAAAYKHVPIAEQAIVPAARVNVLGTAEVVRAGREAGARFVLVSSDKAAQPRSVMGATKRLAELLVLRQRSRLFRPVAVRFGNILGSRGSVLEVMLDAVRAGRPVPVTSPDATRFFMSAEEAASLVLKADLMARGGEVFWLEMGKPVRIGDLAGQVIAQAVRQGAAPVPIDVIGLRPGEKLAEELASHGFEMRRTSHPRIWAARERRPRREVNEHAMRLIRRGCAAGDAVRVLEGLMLAVDGYQPSEAAGASARESRMSSVPVRYQLVAPHAPGL